MILCCCALRVQAGKHSYYRFTVREGLAGDNIYSIVQDNDGFMWVATETGVSRFDGTTFKNFTVKDGLPSNDVNSLYPDQKGRIWMSPFQKGFCYYYRGKIHSSENDSLLRSLPALSENKGFSEDALGNILINTPTEVIYIDIHNRGIRYPNPYSGPGFFEPILRPTATTLPLSIVKPYLRKYKVHAFNLDWCPPIHPWGPGTVLGWVVDWSDRSFIIFREGMPPRQIKVSDNVISVLPLQRPNVLLTSAAGGYIYDLDADRTKDTLLSGIVVNCCIVDADSGIWLGTSGAGVYYFPLSAGRLISDKGLQVYDFYRRNDELWIGSNNWQFWKLNKDHTAIERKMTPKEVDPVLLSSPEGNMRRLPYYGLVKLLREKGIFKNFMGHKSLMNIKDTFVMATGAGALYKLRPPNLLLDSVNVGQRLTCGYYRNGVYYAGTLDGLFMIPPGQSSYPVKGRTPLVKGSINAIAYSYKNDLLWVTTSDNGVYYIRDDEVVRRFDETNGLTSPICKCLFTDGTKAYVGTIDGLNVIDPEQAFRIDWYKVPDGLPSNNINCIYAEGKQVWVGTSEGLALLDISRVRRKPFFNLVLTNITVSGQGLPSDTGDINLAPGDNNIRFSFAGISLPSLGDVRYSYRLNGLSSIWQQTREQSLHYPSLPPGAYILELYATDRFDGRSNTIRFAFTVQKKWWHYGWVQFAFLLLVLGLFFSVFWWRTQRVQKRRREKVELKSRIIELEQMALRAQMNPHFIFNSLNSFYQYVIDKDLAGASKFIQDFSRLLRLLFETSALPAISLDKELDFLTTYLELERTKHSEAFSYSLQVQPDLLTEEIVIPSFVIQPFIENSIRHGIQNRRDKAGHIDLAVNIAGDCLVVAIADNGVGRRYTEALKQRTITIHNSKGIALTEERIALYNRSHRSNIRFEIIDQYETGTATGTLVLFYFPLNQPI
ncbi:sensor histidine kinase [Taibaiella koreensis]|uniref:sensor histidine kinase n=1 Tax=Taibaiella koreensis TaxID=1268548 RepID=UPI0013C2D5AB|nr:two-component regulator propeller domain-containing protein [Taibaiella koreensis]